MLTDEAERDLRNAFARLAGQIDTIESARERLLRRPYRLPRPRRRLAVVVTSTVLMASLATALSVTLPGGSPTVGRVASGHFSLRLVDNQVRLVSSTSAQSIGTVEAISCATASDCEAIGTAVNGPSPIAVGTKDGGETWSRQQLPTDVTTLSSLWCVSSANCVAAGTSTGGAVIVSTADGGTTWVKNLISGGEGSNSSLSSVSCASADACWAVGRIGTKPAILSGSTGSAWTSVPVPPAVTDLSAVGCDAQSAQRFCFAVGSAGSTPAVVESYAGSAWTVSPAPPGATELASASCVGTGGPVCSTLAWMGSYWVMTWGPQGPEAPTHRWIVPNPGISTFPGTVVVGVLSCECNPPNAALANSVIDLIDGLNGVKAPPTGSLVSSYFSTPPSTLSGQLSPVWYMGLENQGLIADLVLTPAQRLAPGPSVGAH